MKKYYVVVDTNSGWDCVIGLYLSINDEEVYKKLCIETYGVNYTSFNLDNIKENYYVTRQSVKEIKTKQEIRREKIKLLRK